MNIITRSVVTAAIAFPIFLSSCSSGSGSSNARNNSASGSGVLVITGTPLTTIDANSSYSFIPMASDPEGDTLYFGIIGLPSWASFSGKTGEISGTPRNAHVGESYAITVMVTDGVNIAKLAPFTITVNSVPNSAPDITGTPVEFSYADSTFSFTPTASDIDLDPITFSVTNLPSWASFDESTGEINGTPASTDIADYPDVTIEVSDGTLSSTLPPFTISIVGTGAEAGIIYVDPTLLSVTCDNYSPKSRECGGGIFKAYNTLSGGADNAVAGDIVYLRGHNYDEALIPANSGIDGSPITFTKYQNEAAIITGPLSPAIDISNKSYIVLDGFEVNNVFRWLHAVNTNYSEITNMTFRDALDPWGSSKTGIFFQAATYNKILNNVIDNSTQDNLSLINAHYNVVEGNQFTLADHALWTIKCGDYNVLRNNYFHNANQKIGEIYDCDAVGFDHDVTLFNSTEHNLVEGNEFAFTASSGRSSPYSGIQHAGQKSIIRKNIFHDTIGPALQMTLYADEAMYNSFNRIYNNVFFSTDFAGVELPNTGLGTSFVDNIFKNNIFAKSIFVANDTRWTWYTGELDGKPVQIKMGRTDGFSFDTNAVFNTAPDELYLITEGIRTSSSNPAQQTVTWWQTNYPAVFSNMLEADPVFVSELTGALDFNLQSGSPMIDAGTFLSSTIGAGSGKTLTVSDATYFFDGYGIPGQQGDLIQLEGQTTQARIVSIDYVANTITVDTALNWTDGLGVSLAYNGVKPDLGAYESP